MKETLKQIREKLARILKTVFGIGILLCLITGGLTFFGYLLALIIGGAAAESICTFLYKTLFPVIVYTSTVMVLLGLVSMYLSGEKALTSEKKHAVKHEGEM